MLLNAFVGKPGQPTDDELTAELGSLARTFWDQRSILYRHARAVLRRRSLSEIGRFEAARQLGLPPRVIRIIDEAKRYPEGTAVRIDVTGAKGLAVIRKLAAIKIEH